MHAARSKRASVLKVALVWAAAVLAAVLVALVATQQPAEAAFPGKNGRIVFESNRTTGAGVDNPTGDYEIFAANPDGTGLVQLTHNILHDHHATYSPDGTRIAFLSGYSVGESGYADFDIYTIPADGGTPTNLTNTSPCYIDDPCPLGIPSAPAWSPDGSQIVYGGFYTVNANGGPITRLFDPAVLGDYPGGGYPPFSWSPDGSNIAFWNNFYHEENPTGDGEIFTVTPDGTSITRLTDNAAEDRDPDHSPDGTRIALSSNRTTGAGVDNPTGDYEIFTVGLGGAGLTQVTHNTSPDHHPAYSPDGTKIAYGNYEGGNVEVLTASATGEGTPTNVTNYPNAFDGVPDWQPIPGRSEPQTKADCKKGGYEEFGFENQGRCVAFVERRASANEQR
jgi:Tol biopolymer transport system component